MKNILEPVQSKSVYHTVLDFKKSNHERYVNFCHGSRKNVVTNQHTTRLRINTFVGVQYFSLKTYCT